MNSIKELKEQLGYEEIGLDDIFVFHCTQCGKMLHPPGGYSLVPERFISYSEEN